jgi:hypothetical protein
MDGIRQVARHRIKRLRHDTDLGRLRLQRLGCIRRQTKEDKTADQPDHASTSALPPQVADGDAGL